MINLMGDYETRGDQCGVFATKDTAHCLVFSDTIFQGYEVSAPRITFEIVAQISIPSGKAENHFTYETLKLTESKRFAKNSFVKLEFLGDF